LTRVTSETICGWLSAREAVMIDTPAMPATCSSVARPVPLPLLRPVLSIVILS